MLLIINLQTCVILNMNPVGHDKWTQNIFTVESICYIVTLLSK